MKSGVQTAGFLLLFLFVFVFFSSSCESRIAQDRFAYAKEELNVEISGTIDEKEVRAIMYNRPNAKNEEIKAVLRFTFPESLEGMTVTLLANGDCNVRLGGAVVDTEGFEGLVEPFRPVFEPGEIHSVKKNSRDSDDVRVCDENCDITYRFVNNFDIPSRIWGECGGKKLDFTIFKIPSDSTN